MLTFKELKAETVVLNRDDKSFMCYICEWFIVMPPIYLNPAGGFICGFCYQDRKYYLKNEHSLLPQQLYEDIVIYLRFPCKYCEFFIIFNEPAAMHEVQCAKRIFQCPLSRGNRCFMENSENCDWKDDDGKSMVAHVKENHKEYILPSPFKIRFGDMKFSEFKKHIYIAILNNRKIISIITENDEENKCIIFRCRSNKSGHPDINYRSKIEYKSVSEAMMNKNIVKVFPLGARILEKPSDYCSVPLEKLEEDTVFQFTFSPSPCEKFPDTNFEGYDDDSTV